MKKHNLKTVGRPLKYPAGFKAIGRILYVSVRHKDAGQLIVNWGHIFGFEFWHSRTSPLTFKGVQPENSRLKIRPQIFTISFICGLGNKSSDTSTFVSNIILILFFLSFAAKFFYHGDYVVCVF
jgi:hypothetical protein